LKVSANVKIAMQCFEIFGEGKFPPFPGVARLPGAHSLRKAVELPGYSVGAVAANQSQERCGTASTEKMQ